MLCFPNKKTADVIKSCESTEDDEMDSFRGDGEVQ